MENVENVEEDLKQNTYIMYEKRYESCQKKLDKLALVSDRVSLLRGITFVIAGLLLLFGYQQKSPALFVLAAGQRASAGFCFADSPGDEKPPAGSCRAGAKAGILYGA